MSAESGETLFRGYADVEYVAQPPNSEQCFAAIVSAVSGAALHESQAALYQGGFVTEDGGTGMFWAESEIEAGGTSVHITPLEAPEDPEDVLALIDEQFDAGKAVALLHKKTGDIEDGSYHWILLTGSRSEDQGETLVNGAIHVMDPLSDPGAPTPAPGEEMRYVARERIADIIRQSTDFREGSRAQGVFPHAISTS